MSENLFAYGTLQEKDIQQYVFGRMPKGKPDSLPGYTLSAKKMYGRFLVLEPCTNADRDVKGTVYSLTPDEMSLADVYEGPEYRRIQVTLGSGSRAWVYLGQTNPESKL